MKLISFFDRHRCWNNKRNSMLQKLGFYGSYNYLLDLFANLYLRLHFKFTASHYNLLNSKQEITDGLIISLTSYPKRIGYLWMTLETLLRQDILPERIIVYLSKLQFPGETANLPRSLKRMIPRGIEFEFVDDDLRSHKKYYYALQRFPDKTIVTVDDDCLYPEDLIRSLWNTHLEFPKAIVGNRAKRIYPHIPRYEHWPQINCKAVSYDFLFVGCAGILYPPNCLYKDAFNVDLIKSLSFSADDIWLSCMARLNGMQMVSTGFDYRHLRILIPGDTPLLAKNAVGGNQEVVEKLNEYYLKKIGKRPFIDMVGE